MSFEKALQGLGLCQSAVDFVTDCLTAFDLYGLNVSQSIFGGSQALQIQQEETYCSKLGLHNDPPFHIWWGSFTIFIIFIPGLVTSVFEAIEAMQTQSDTEETQGPDMAICFLHFCGWSALKILFYPFISLYYRFRFMMGYMEYQWKVLFYMGMEGHMESGYQALLQLYILCHGYTATTIQGISMLSSILAVGTSVTMYDLMYELKFRDEIDDPWTFREKVIRLMVCIPIYILSFLSRAGMLVVVISFFHWMALIPLGCQLIAVSLLSMRMGLGVKSMFLTAATNILIHGNPMDNNPFRQQGSSFNSTAFRFRLLTSLISIVNYGFWLTLTTVFIREEVLISTSNCRMLSKDDRYIRFGGFLQLHPWAVWGLLVGLSFLHLVLLYLTTIPPKVVPAFMPRSYAETKNISFEQNKKAHSRRPAKPKVDGTRSDHTRQGNGGSKSRNNQQARRSNPGRHRRRRRENPLQNPDVVMYASPSRDTDLVTYETSPGNADSSGHVDLVMYEGESQSSDSDSDEYQTSTQSSRTGRTNRRDLQIYQTN